jgi:hypothetical protein
VVSSSQLNLTWTDQSNNEDGFRVYRGTDSSTVTTLVATLGAGTTSHLDTSLAASTTHYYKVTAFNTVGESAASNVANATTDPPPVTIPAPPTILKATATSSSAISLTWTDQSGNETDFQIERKTGAGGTYAQIGTAAANATTYRDSGLAEGATYIYRVRAVNSVGNSAYSNESSATTPSSSSKSVVITGTVPGTVAIAYDYATGLEAARNVASGTPKTFSLNVAPGEYYLMFITNEGTPSQRSFAFQNVTGGNVFTIKANTTLDLGVLVFYNYPITAKPLIDPISGNDNVTETFTREASFSPGPGEWIATRKFLNYTCYGHSPGSTVTEDVTIRQGWGIVTFDFAGTTETAIGVANVNTAILTASDSALVTIYLTMQSDGSLAGTYSKVGFGGECSEDATITAVLRPPPPAAGSL